MKTFSLLLPVLALTLVTASAEPVADEATTRTPAAEKLASTEDAPPWSVVGTWDCTQLGWSGALVLKENGLFTGPTTELSGHWALGAQGGRVQLVLYWNAYPAEIMTLINADEFRGDPGRSGHPMRRRQPAAADGKTLNGGVEFRSWHQGEPPVKLIARDEGFCALTSVTGRFEGEGEKVRVYVGDDGYWYLGGDSHQREVAAECVVVRYRK